ncbi:MAG: PPOX class F420-dependent oxidoreductase [Anaerolineales bacterium]|nr:PPOX class F420-dependent oxidoreductase [Anaerolineales bacterium]
MFPEEYLDLLSDDTPAFLFLATSMADGSPQVTPVWFNTDGKHILVNTARGRTKDRNMRARPQVALCIQDPKSPYRYLQVRGRVTGDTEEGAIRHIEDLAIKYTGKPWRGSEPGETRVIYKIKPEHIDKH